MTEQEAALENQQVEAQAAPENVVESNPSQPVATQQPAKDVDKNWAEVRRKMDLQERTIREQQEKLDHIHKSMQKPQDDELDKLGDEEIVTKGQVRKLAAKMAKEISQEVLKQHENSRVEERLKMRLPDFDQIVSPENVEMLKQRAPSLAYSLSQGGDPYAQAIAVYEAIKAMNPGGYDTMAKDKERADKNAQKPRSASTMTQSAIGNAHVFENGLTPELKKQLWNEMEAARKRA